MFGCGGETELMVCRNLDSTLGLDMAFAGLG